MDRVLVVDDREIDRYVAEHYIKKHGLANKVILKDSVDEAITYLRSAHQLSCLPELILLDIRMPEKDGFDFLDEYANLSTEIQSHCVCGNGFYSLHTGRHSTDEFVSISKILCHEAPI